MQEVSSWSALPCPALPCPALPCPALPCPALPCPASFINSEQFHAYLYGQHCQVLIDLLIGRSSLVCWQQLWMLTAVLNDCRQCHISLHVQLSELHKCLQHCVPGSCSSFLTGQSALSATCAFAALQCDQLNRGQTPTGHLLIRPI